MADDYSYFDPRGDTPIGSTWGIGNTEMNPNDPLNDWASNLTPQALQTLRNQYPQDPAGAIQSLVDQGHPPPDHHYTQDANGNLQPTTAGDAAAYDAAKQRLAAGLQAGQQPNQPIQAPPTQLSQAPIQTDAQGRIIGNLTSQPLGFSSAPPPRPEDTAQTPSAGRTPPPTQVTPPSGPLAGGTPQLGEPQGPLGPMVKWLKDRWYGTGDAFNPQPAPGTPLPRPRPASADEGPQPASYTTPGNIPPIPEQQPPNITMKKKAKEDEEETPTEKALSGFSKSLAGVKVPERKPLPPPSGLGVRSPVSVQQTLGSLLASAGAHTPATAPPTGLIRLLKGY